MKHIYTLAFCLGALFSAQGQVDTDIELVQFATGFSSPVDITNAGDDRLFVVQQTGSIRILRTDGTIDASPFLNMSSIITSSGNEQGLLGLAFHPNYADNGFFYVNYTRNNGDTRISRFTVSDDPDVADFSSRVDILTIDQPFTNHNGGCIKFGPDGYLYIGTGDGGSGEDPLNAGQTMSTYLGKMLRIDVDGASPYEVPTSNPFYNSSSDTLPEIWASGLRNPWRYAFDQETGDLWIADVGQYQWEEIDFQAGNSTGGENYGWNCYEGNHDGFGSNCPPMDEFVGAVAEFNHNAGHCSITGGQVYRGSAFPNLNAKYFSVDYCSGQFWSTEKNDADEFITFQVTGQEGFGYSAMGHDQFGEIYVTNLSQGRVYRLIDESCEDNNANLTSVDGVTLEASQGTAYQWYLNGEVIPMATSQSYTAAEDGVYNVFIQFSEFCADYSQGFEVVLTGLEELTNGHGMQILQNPASDELNLLFSKPLERGADLRIIDAMGRVVLESAIDRGQDYTINISALNQGRYSVQLSDEITISALPLIIQR